MYTLSMIRSLVEPSTGDLDVLDELRVEIAEAGEVVLIEVHHEQLVGRGQVHRLRGELTVKVGHILPMPLKKFTC